MRGATTQPAAILMVHLVVVPWLCLLAYSAAELPAAAALASSENAVHAPALKAEYIQVNFSTASATPDRYKSFIDAVRAGLVSKAGGSSSGIPVLLSEDDPLALEAFLSVTLVNKAGRSVTLKMDVASAYFVAYEAGKNSCLLKRSGRAFSSAICYSDPWSSASSSSAVTLLPRSTIILAGGPSAAGNYGTKDLDEAISSLFLFPTGNATKAELSRGVAVCDMMIATAAAFPYVERRISAGMADGNGGVPNDDPTLLGLQATWPSLSAAVQESYQGAFAAPVAVQRSNGEWMQLDNVRRAVPLVSFLEYHQSCDDDEEREAVADQQLPLLIKSVVQQDQPDEEELGGAAAAAAACGEAEPTVQLAGPEGRCVDVPYGYYYSGIQVQLWSCKSNGDVNQLWTLKRDGTIRSNGKCLTASGDAAGASVVINDCPRAAAPTTATASRAVWEVRVDGTIALKGSSRGGLVLAVTSSTLFAGLTVQVDDRGTGQSWTPTNDTAPIDAAIVGFRDLCLQVDDDWAVSVAACRGGSGGVRWSIYPDGSIRPPAWLLLQWQCLAADATGRVRVKYCDGAGSSCERWVFRNDGTIFNTGTGMVLDVVRPAAAGATASQVIVSPANAIGGPIPTQQWTLML